MRTFALVAPVAFALAGSIVGLACSKPKDGSPGATTTSPSSSQATGVAPPMMVDAAAPVPAAAKAARCPTLVVGASATAADTADGVALTISAKDPAAVTEIRARAHGIDDWVKQSAAKRAGSDGKGGDGNGAGDGVGGGGGAGGGGGGGMGKCPIVTRYTTLDVKDSPSGAVVTMRPISDRDLVGLRRQVRERLAGD